MPLVDEDRIIKEYYQTVKDKYPDLDYERFYNLCKAPFRFFKTQMEREDMPIILIKYFGKFRVLSSKVKELLRLNNIKLGLGQITVEQHSIRENNYNQRLKLVLEDEAENPDSEGD